MLSGDKLGEPGDARPQFILPERIADVRNFAMASQFMSIAIQNIAAEFQPQWGPIVRKLRIQKIIPEWWVPQHEK